MKTPDHTSTGLSVENVSAWILRLGLALAIIVMLTGLLLFLHNPHLTVHQIQSARFDPQFSHLLQGLKHLDGQSIIQLGIYLLVLTPIFRVAASCIVFALSDHNRTYTLITLLVLALTLVGLLWLG